MAKMRSIAPHRCRYVIALLLVRTACASESLLLPSPTGAQGSASPDYGYWRVIVALAVVAVLILVMQWLIRRGRGKGVSDFSSDSTIQIVARKPLSPRNALLLIRVGKRGVLLHQSKGTLSPLCEIDFDPEEPEE